MPDGGHSFTPRGFTAAGAAYYVGMGEAGWLAEVKAGKAPQPVYPTPRRPVWAREDLDLFMDVLTGRAAAVDWLDPRSYRRQAPAETAQGW
ncbi:hypothetical protein EAH89_17120 [Roseomonas nepalensis]|uniref:Uncharacterized protein n=1 Tax=Muricoccus nepalensis TaxID=1854500 RepID=A0A502FV29_9PROT|nr:hypothetical protein [Roseomonas nepalensis]TPG53240.1 hypothetical protein EAH89_17120 [Roseomonas nepalensis]